MPRTGTPASSTPGSQRGADASDTLRGPPDSTMPTGARARIPPLEGPVSAGPVADGARVYLAFKTGNLTARAVADGHEVWRIKKDVSAPMATGGDLLFIAGGDAVEALKAGSGAAAWVLPRTTLV